MGRPFFHKWMMALGLIVCLSMIGCSSSSGDFSDDAEDEFMSEEFGNAGTDAAPEEHDQLVAQSNSDKAETPVAKESDFEELEDKKFQDEKKEDASLEVGSNALARSEKNDEFGDPQPSAEAVSSLDSGTTDFASDLSGSKSPSFSKDGEGEFVSYRVQSGDTLMRIAFEQYGDLFAWKKIYEANKDVISDPNRLPKGVTLKLSKGSGMGPIGRGDERYLIKWGDTLGTISDDIYGTPKKWRKLYEQNSSWIKDPNKIYAGFYLYYSLTPEERQEADRIKATKSVAPMAKAKSSSSREPSSAQ
jgi:nucleoid-associated protein YgaU